MDPITVNLLSANGEITNTWIWVGDQEEKIQKELDKLAIQKPFNKELLVKQFGDHRVKTWAKTVSGGDEFDLVDIPLDTSMFTDLVGEVNNRKVQKSKVHKVNFVYTNIHQMDSVLDFKYKIFLATGIGIYRQHLWFKRGLESFPMKYEVLLEETHIKVNFEHYFQEGEKEMIENIPVEMNIYTNREFLKVHAYDKFELMGLIYSKYGCDTFNLVDLNSLIQPTDIWSKLSRDKNQLDIIYYGFIILYFPIISYEVFQDYLRNETSLPQSYPDLLPNKLQLDDQYEIQNAVIKNGEENIDITQSENFGSSIIKTNIAVPFSPDIPNLINLHNLFDLFVLNQEISVCYYKTSHYLYKKTYALEDMNQEYLLHNTLTFKINVKENYFRMIIYENGFYMLKTNWREDSQMSFPLILKQCIPPVNRIIKWIVDNKIMRFNVKIPFLTEQNAQFSDTSMILYYEDAMSDDKYEIVKKILADWVTSGIVFVKEITPGYLSEYYFFKGMYAYDLSRLEMSFNVDNYYEFLTSSTIKQKWMGMFEKSRLFTVSMISSKIRFTIDGIRNDVELGNFFTLIAGLLYVYQINKKQMPKKIVDMRLTKNLKNLKLQDPLLYNPSKINKTKLVYSRLCQSKYQPVILNEDEYKALDKEEKTRVVDYWNFTKKKPAKYFCPNKSHPYIKFLIKAHPMDFCIPCCKKMEMNERVNRKKQQVHDDCLKKHIYSDEKVLVTKGNNYVASYGKELEVGRLSRLPEHTLEPILFNTDPSGVLDSECLNNDGYYLYGVDQNLPNLSNCGMLFCLANALHYQEEHAVFKLLDSVKVSQEQFKFLLNGHIEKYFTNHKELNQKLKQLADGQMMDDIIPWNELFISLAYYCMGINVIRFIDQSKEIIDLKLPAGLKRYEDMFPETHKNLIVLQRRRKFYPIYLINNEVYKRTGVIDVRIFDNNSGAISVISSIVKVKLHPEADRIDLAIIEQFRKCEKYFVNDNNLCYAVQIDQCYFPVEDSHFNNKDKDISYDRPIFGSGKKSMELYLKYNHWAKGKYPQLKPQRVFKKDGLVHAFVSNGLMFYFQPIKELPKEFNAPQSRLLYSSEAVHQLIKKINSEGFDQEMPEEDKLLANGYDYERLLVQLSNYFNMERDDHERKKIIANIIGYDFSKPSSKLNEILSKYDLEDQKKLKSKIFAYAVHHHDQRRLIDEITTGYYSFDRKNLEKLRQMESGAVRRELEKIANKITIDKSPGELPNILRPCPADDCINGKMPIAKAKRDKYLDIIAKSIKEPIIESVRERIEMNKFYKRPLEKITIQAI